MRTFREISSIDELWGYHVMLRLGRLKSPERENNNCRLKVGYRYCGIEASSYFKVFLMKAESLENSGRSQGGRNYAKAGDIVYHKASGTNRKHDGQSGHPNQIGSFRRRRSYREFGEQKSDLHK
jgi:hypothetical protein